MKGYEKYLEALKTFDDFISMDQWIKKIIEMYPEELKEAERINSQEKRTPTGKLKKAIPSRINNKTCKAAIKKDENTGKYKYIPEEQRSHELNSDTEIYITLSEMLNKLESIKHIENSHNRDDKKYIGNNKEKGIEQINAYEFNAHIMFEMATRNDDVIEIINKLNFLEKLKEKHPYLKDSDCLSAKPIDNKFECQGIELTILDETQEEFPILSSNTKEICKDICNLSLSKFKDELNFLIDNTYSDNFNQNYLDDMNNDNIDILKITDDKFYKYKFINTDGKTSVNQDLLSFHKLLIIENYLQDKLNSLSEFMLPLQSS